MTELPPDMPMSETYRARVANHEATPEYWCWAAEFEADAAGHDALGGRPTDALACIARAREALNKAEALLGGDRP